MLSATPVNSDLRDLRNQVLLMNKGNSDGMFEKTGIQKYSNQRLKLLRNSLQLGQIKIKILNRNVKQLLERLDSSFFKLLDEITIARSRKHIKSFYDFEAIGKFSERLKPISIYADIDLQDRFLTYESINEQISKYKLSVFNPSAYVRQSKRKKYEELGANREFGFKQSHA